MADCFKYRLFRLRHIPAKQLNASYDTNMISVSEFYRCTMDSRFKPQLH